MALTKTPICDFGKKADHFELNSTDNKIISLDDVKGENGTLIMFICNDCPYVKAVIKEIVSDCQELEKIGIKSVAIMSNDTVNYPDDSFDKMIEFSKDNSFGFPYLIDESQEIAKKYDAVCTPDLFGFDKNLVLKYRGRLDSGIMNNNNENIDKELFNAMIKIKNEGFGPKEQNNSVGCSIKWK